MARIFITGSADGLGLMAGALLATHGHDALPHARLADRWLRRDLSNLEAADSEHAASMNVIMRFFRAIDRWSANPSLDRPARWLGGTVAA
jgi:NAD(P)-dependent dehydrogenase (short-subunit alcohol dehydrogenase family)